MHPHVFRRIVEQALKVTLATPLILSGCAPSLDGYASPDCDNGELSVRGLTPPVVPDVIQLRYSNGLTADGGADFRVISSTGTACATAADAGGCALAFAALNPQSTIGGACFGFCSPYGYFFATTHGDEVKSYATVEEAKALLGAIDTAQEAAMLAWLSGYGIACNDIPSGGVKTSREGGFDVVGTSGVACGAGTHRDRNYLHVSEDGTVTSSFDLVLEYGMPGCAIGRRPHGMGKGRGSRCTNPVGRYYAEAARLEAASVPAFLILRDELRAHRAPRAMLGSAVLAALEEVTHARATAALARAFGGRPVAPKVMPRRVRPLLQVAIDNAVEGCVRETWGALLARRQSQTAAEPEVRALMGPIAVDEARHAALSWEIDAWAQRQLGRRDRTALRAARRQAVEELRQELSVPPNAELQRAAGIPGPDEALAHADALFGALAHA